MGTSSISSSWTSTTRRAFGGTASAWTRAQVHPRLQGGDFRRQHGRQQLARGAHMGAVPGGLRQ
eukprot:1508954-Alexandrium_andersonii.AAC.1